MGFNPLFTAITINQWVETHWRKSPVFTLMQYSRIHEVTPLRVALAGVKKVLPQKVKHEY